MFDFIKNFPRQEYIYLHNVPFLYKIVVLLSNFISLPYSRPIYLKIERLIKQQLLESNLVSPNISKCTFKQFLRYLKQDIRKLEIIIYAFVHKKKVSEVSEECHAISRTAEQFQCYSKSSIYNRHTSTFKLQKNKFLSLPDIVLVKIMKCLNNESLVNFMLSCKQIFQIGSLFGQPNVRNRTDITLHPSNGICIQYKFAFDLERKKRELTIGASLRRKLTYPIDLDLCVCPLCYLTCSCDFSKHQHAGQLKKLLFKNCKLGTVIINTYADFHYMISTLKNVPRSLKIDMTIGKYGLRNLFNKFKFYYSLDYILDVRMFTNIQLYWPIAAPVVDRLHIQFLPTSPSYTSDLPAVKTILRSHLKAIKKGSNKMTKLSLTNCLLLEEVFFFRSLNTKFVWLETIKEIHINKSRIKCSLFKQLKQMTSLTLLNINRSELYIGCEVKHFNHYFRTDFLNFESVPNTNHVLFRRNSFLKILCDTKNTHCPCPDLLKKPLATELLNGQFKLQKCKQCIMPPKECKA